MDKQSLILKLHKEGAITEDEAKILLEENERIVYVDRYTYPSPQIVPINPFHQPLAPWLPGTFCSAGSNLRIE